MDFEIINNLIQYPILGFFAWWVYQTNKRFDANNDHWREYLKERNGKLEKALERLSDVIDKKV